MWRTRLTEKRLINPEEVKKFKMGCYSIKHHGIKGQHWGVRRGPPYPIEDKVLRKGTRLNSVSLLNDSEAYRKSKRWMYTYNPDDDWDSKVYKGPFSAYKTNFGQRYIYEHQFEVVSDLKMPTKKERVDEFINMYKKRPIRTASDLETVRTWLKQYNVGSKEVQNTNVWKLRTPDDYKRAYEIFNHAMEHVDQFASTQAYAKIMATKYDAMVDDNNQEVYNKAHDPIIIFRAETALKEIGEARLVDINEMRDSYNEVARELAKKGEAVKL